MPSACAASRPENAPVKLRWMLSLDLHKTTYEALVREFELQHPEIDIEVLWVPANQYPVKFRILAAAGQTPDLFYCGDVWAAAMRPFMRDLSPWIERDAAEIDLADFPDRLLEACRVEGRWYYLPWSFNVSLLYFNRSLFEAAGEPPPSPEWTWDDYLAAAQRLTQHRADGRTAQWGTDILLGWWGEWLTLVRQSGGTLFTPDIDRCVLDTPEAVRALSFYSDKVRRWRIAPPPGFGPAAGFAARNLAMQWGGHTGKWAIYNATPDLDWDIEVLPKGPAGRAGGELAVEAYALSNTCAHPEAAWTFLKFVSSRDGLRPFVARGNVPVRWSLAREFFEAPDRTVRPANWRALYRALEGAQPTPQTPDFIEVVLEIIQPEIDLMIEGRQTPAETAARASRAADAFISTLGARRPAP